MADNLVITNFRRIGRNHLLASFDVEIPHWHLMLCGVLK